jgi:hypothetical protein
MHFGTSLGESKTTLSRAVLERKALRLRDLEEVAGAGFEPAIRRLPDYEPDGGVKPIIR